MRLFKLLSALVLFVSWTTFALGQGTRLDTIERNTESPSLLELIKGGKRTSGLNQKDDGAEEKEYVYNIKNLNGEKVISDAGAGAIH